MKKLLTLALSLAFAHALSAQTLVHRWQFGEDDPGATNGASVTTTKDSVGSMDLTASGSVTYSSTTAGSPSTLAQSFSTTGSYTGTVDLTLTNSEKFIIEGWFYFSGATPNSTNMLFYNGNPSSTGSGLYVNGTTLRYLRGGSSDAVAGTVLANQWNYIAMVYNSGSVGVYVNTDVTPSYTAAESFTANSGGAGEAFYVGGGFNGAIDELRTSTFTGTFNTAMLSYDAITAVPEPSTYAALAGLAALGLVVWRRRVLRA